MAKIKQSKLNEIKGYNEYKKRKEEKEQKAQKEESAAQAASPSTSNTKNTSNTNSNKTVTTNNTTSSTTTQGAKIKQSKLNEIKGYKAYKDRKEARKRNEQVPPNSTPVADKTKLNDGYTIESIRENLGYSQTALEDSIKRLEESKNVLTSSENEVTNFLKKYGATAEDIHSKMATKYGAKLDTSGKYIFEDEQSYSDYQKEIAALGALYDQYNANMNQYNALYTQYQDSAVNYEDWYGRLEGYQPRDATLKDLLWNSLKQGYYNSIYGQESYKQMLGDENQAAAYKELLSGEDYQFETDNWLEKAVSGAANQLGQQFRQWTDPRSLASGTAFATGAAVLGQTGPQIALPEEVITVPGAFITGMQAGSAASNFEIEGGLAYQEMLEQGISPEVARIIGLSVGGGNAALEALQADELIKGLKVFNNKQGYESVAELLYAELKRRFPNLANQVIQEVAQEGVTIGGTQLASYIDKGELAYTMPETLQRLGETALSSTLTFGLMDVPGATMNVAANKANVNRLGKIGSEYNVDAEAVIAEGLAMPKNTEAYQTAVELKAKVDAGQTVSDAELGRAVVANEMAIQQNQVTDEAAQPAEKAQKALENLARDAVAYRENFQQAEPTQSETVSEQATVPYNVMSDTNPVRQKKVAETRSLEKKLGYGEEGLKLFKEIAAETNVDTDELMVRFDTPYQAGLTGLPMAKANLVDNFQTEAYNAGRMDNIARMAKDTESKPSTIYSEKESGFDFTNAPSDLTQEQKDFAVFFNKAMGVKGEFNGYEGVNYNAKYSKSTGVVAFAQDFGIDSKLMKKLGSMEYQQKVEKLVETRGKSFIFYFAHEVADHVASNRAPAAMRAFNNAMYNYQQSSAGSENLARSKQAFYGDNKVDLSTEGAIEEVGADSILMLYDGDEKKFMDAMTRVLNGNDKQAKEGAKLYKNKLDEIIQKLKAWFRKLTGKENAEARANLKQGISELEQLRDMFEKAIGESAAVVKKARADREVATVKEELGAGATIQRNKSGELLLAKSKDNSTIIYSLKTYQDGGKDKLREALLRNGHTRTEIDSVLELIDDAADYLTILAAGYAKSHNYTALHDHLIADITTNVKTGKQVMSALVNNGDYPVNFDMALICKKRIAYMTLMTRLIEDGIFDLVNFKGEAIADVNDILRANNFETACLGCFVESRRLQFQAWAETIVSEWNAEVDKRKKNAKEFGFSKGRVKLTDTEMDFLQNELKNAGKKNKQGNLNLGKGSAQVRIGRLLDMVPSLQQRLTVADLLTPNGLAALREYDANLFSIVKSRYGAASPKIVQDFNPYASEIAMMTFKSVSEITSNAVKGAQEYIKQAKKDLGGIKKMAGETDAEFRKRRAAHNAKAETEAMRRYLYDIGGARIQSFSDFMIENVFDYLQIMADLSANRFPLHGYTKENICLRLFGMTGAKWNGSLIAHVERSMGKEYAGLLPASAAKDGSAILVHTEDGDYAIGFDDYARNKATGGKSFIQSIGMKDIIAVQLDPRYSKNVGSITIGVSDKQILAMLDSPLFSMVIPYHASGMLPGFARRVGVDMYNDYTDYQNTSVRQMYDANGNIVESLVNAKGDTIKIDTSYAFNAEVQKTGDARTAANNYIKWCAERHPVYDGKTLVGYATFSPKFSNSPYGTDFSRHPNYYKLLADFNTYDCITGESAVQGAVTMTFPSENNRLTASQMEAYKQRLRDTGVFSEKEIAKYEAQANKTFKDLVNDELKGRADYKVTQDAKWEKTVKEIKDKLMSDHARDNVSSEAKELSDSETQYSLREKEPPKKTGVAYKVFYAKDGQLYPPMVANPGGAGTPVGVWLDADIGAAAAPSKTGRAQVQAGGKGTNASKGSLAFRPGWHLGDIPQAKQFARKNPETGEKDLFPADFVWAECEYAMDHDYQEEAMSYGYTENGKFRHSYAGLPRLPEDGYYRYRTNPNPDTVPWVITGAMKVTRILTDEETDAICRAAGVEPMKRQGGPIDLAKYGLKAGDTTQFSLKDSQGNALTQEQAEYFKDSKVRDKDGNLIRLYHGTEAFGFTKLDFDKSDDGISFFMTDSPDVAGSYSGTSRMRSVVNADDKQSDPYGNYELYANLTNPLIIEAFEANWDSIYIPGHVDRDELQKIAGNKRFNEAKTRDFAKYAKAKGYDGVIFKNLVDTGSQGIGHEGASTVVIAFDSNQVKDAYNLKPTTDSDLRYSLKDNYGRTLSKEQQEFFKDSKVRDENGNLLVMYHGTLNGGFTVFDPEHSDDRTSLFFTSSLANAQSYSGAEGVAYADGGAQNYPVYLNLSEPLVIDADGSNWDEIRYNTPDRVQMRKDIDAKWKQLYGMEHGSAERDALWEELNHLEEEYEDSDVWSGDMRDTRGVAKWAKQKGYNSVIIHNLTDYGGEMDVDIEPATVAIAFSSEQVKSVTNTNPTDDKDINYSLKGEHEMRREIDRIRKEGAKAGKSKLEIENEVMGVVGPEYGKLLKTYGEIKRGERPYREISVPRLTEDDRKVSQTIRTILEAEATPDAAIPTIQEMITKGDFSYDVYTDKEARAAAEATIRRKGYETALADWLSEVKEGKVNKTNTALGWELYNQAATKGDLKTAMSVLNGMVQHQRNAAQALQATRILKKMAPDAQLYGIQRSVESLQENLAKKYGDKVPDLKVDEELAKKLLKAKTDEERDEATKEIYIDIGRQMPSTFIDKWNAWRYLAMLGNPRTHVRNVVGNLGFAPVVAAKDLTATFIESVVSFASKGKLDRTKAMPNAKLLKAAWADYANVADEVTAGGKYSDSFMQNQYIQEGREIFKFKPLEKARKGNSAALEMEDMWFAQPHYAFALAQYCKAHGVTVEQLKTGKALGNARNYAIREAQKATYRDTNAFSQMVSELGRYSGDNKAKKGLSLVTEGILPFRKTPANILVRGIEYSPIGLLNGIKQALWDVSKGTKTGAEAIDSIAAGATGTVLLGLGVYLASQGLIRGAGGDDEKEKKFEELQGHQTYALELPNGKSITLDWLAPEVLPLFIGVNLCEMAREDKGESNLSDILTAVSNVTEPLLEMSCLQSLNDLFDSVGYAASGGGLSALPSILASAATSYLTQAFPTILGQAERSAQDERMTTYTEKNGFLTSDLQYTIGKISAKIPGWDFQQIPYVDAWGRTESTGSRASNIANNFLNPAYTSRIETSEMEEELQRLHDEKGDEYSVLPSRPNKYFNVDGDRKDLTAEEYVAYATEKGQLSYDILTDLTEKKEYDKLPDAEKARAVEMAYEYANAIAKSKVSDYEPDSWVAKALEAEEFSGMDETEYILYKVALSMADQNNNDNSSYDNTEKAAAIASMKSLSDADIAVLLDTKDSYAAYDAGVDMRNLMAYIGEGKDVNVDKLIGAKEAGISESTYFKYTDTLKAVDQPNSNGEYGGAATNAEKAAAVAKMRDLDNEGIAYLWGTDQAHEAHSYGVDMRKYAQFKGVVGDFKGDDKQQQIKSYLKGMNLSAKDYLYLYGTVYSSVKDDADYLYYFGN